MPTSGTGIYHIASRTLKDVGLPCGSGCRAQFFRQRQPTDSGVAMKPKPQIQ